MSKFKMRLQQFMSGRNGADNLGRTIMYISIALYLISLFFNNNILYMIAGVGMAYCIFRMFSRNIYKRQDENSQYLNVIQKVKYNFEQRKTYRFFKCKGCGKKVRVPRGKGKLEITCPVCSTKMIHRT